MARVAGPAIIQATLSSNASRRPDAAGGIPVPAVGLPVPTVGTADAAAGIPASAVTAGSEADAAAAASDRPAMSTDRANVERTLGTVSGTCHIWAPEGPGIRKLTAGWRPGTIRNPVPAAEVFERASAIPQPQHQDRPVAEASSPSEAR
jgi:hypothetical protein